MSYTVTLPKGMYDWDFNHTGPEGLEIIYVNEEAQKKKAVTYLIKKPPPKQK